MSVCYLCPRNCGVDRRYKTGFCKAGSQIKIARAALHPWEEPCISGTNGSGTVFFSGCQLHCCFCQNHQISTENFGKCISVRHLSDIFLSLQDQGAHNINLVSPTPYMPNIIKALDMVRAKLHIPVVYNSGGYENVQTIHLLKDYVDIFLPDIKYFDTQRSLRYSHAADYFAIAKKAVYAMYDCVGSLQYGEDGLLKKGLILRHLVMPGGRHDSIRLMHEIASFPFKDHILISIMSQFTPFYQCDQYPEINRRITSLEYDSVVNEAMNLGLNHGFIQEKSSAKEEYTPPFNLEGV